MKIRTDFVTNSSSSSFIIARKGELSEKAKDKIIEYVTKEMLGREILTPESTEEEIQTVFYKECIEDEEKQEMMRKALREGRTIYYDRVNFEWGEADYSAMLQNLWEILEEVTGDEFVVLDGDLSY